MIFMYSCMKIIFLGKSTIANAICLCLGAQARTTGRTSNVQSFIRKGET